MDTKILIVEDEAIIARDIQNILKKLGPISSETVSSGEESIVRASELHPHLVIMDIKLKGKLNGMEAAREIFARFGIAIVFLTAFEDEATREKLRMLEHCGCIYKPFLESEVQGVIKSVIDGKRC